MMMAMVDFVPERPVEVAGRDAEIAADIDDDGADRAAAHLRGDFLLRGEARETRVLGWSALGFGPGVRRRELPCGAWRAYGGQADGRRRAGPGRVRRGGTAWLPAPRRDAGHW